MPSPLVHTLLPTALAASSPYPKQLGRPEKIKFFILCVILGNCPDFDLLPTVFNEKWWSTLHRWYGHNVFTFVLLAIAGAFLFKKWVRPLPPGSGG